MNQKVCSNERECSCPNTACENHGRCCDCVAKHRAHGNLPMCLAQMMAKKKM